MNFSHERTASQPGWGLAIVLILIAGGVGVLYGTGMLTGGVKPGSVVSTNNNGGKGLVPTTLPLSIVNNDPFAKAPISTAATVTFYTTGAQFLAACTTSSGTCTTTGVSFTSGQNITVSIVTSGYVTEWIPVTVPYVASGSAGITAIPMALYQIKTESFVTTFQVGTTSVTTGISHTYNTYKYNFSSTAAQPVTVNLNYKTANEGYLGCNPSNGQQYDIINRVCQSAVLQISDTSTGLSVTGMPRQYASGTSRYWWSVMPDGVGVANPPDGGMGALAQIKTPGAAPDGAISDGNTAGSVSEQTIGNLIYGGTASATLTVQQGSVASGSTETLVFTLYVNADPNYFPVNNNLGPNAANASTPFSVIFKAH